MKVMGQRIREERIKHHLTQQQLADKLSVTRQTISNWEKGQAKYIDRYKVNEMAEIFTCNPGWLMDMQDSKVTVTYEAEGKEPIKMLVSDKHDQPIIGTTALKIKLLKTVAKVPPELYEVAIELLESIL